MDNIDDSVGLYVCILKSKAARIRNEQLNGTPLDTEAFSYHRIASIHCKELNEAANLPENHIDAFQIYWLVPVQGI